MWGTGGVPIMCYDPLCRLSSREVWRKRKKVEDLGEGIPGEGGEGRGQGGCYLSVDVLSRVAFPVASTCRSRRGDGAALAVLSKVLCPGLRGLGGAEGKGLSVSHGLCEQEDSIVVLACLRHVRG